MLLLFGAFLRIFLTDFLAYFRKRASAFALASSSGVILILATNNPSTSGRLISKLHSTAISSEVLWLV
jgi:hypothetical protein